MAGLRLPSENDYNALLATPALWSDEDVGWRIKKENQFNAIAELPVYGSNLDYDFLIRLIASTEVDSDFSISLVHKTPYRQIQVRRLDVGHPHSNINCSGWSPCPDAHLHIWTDLNEDRCAIPLALGEYGEDLTNIENAFHVFLRHTSISWSGVWNPNPITNPRFPKF